MEAILYRFTKCDFVFAVETGRTTTLGGINMIWEQYGKYEVDTSSEIVDSQFSEKFSTKYEKEYVIEGTAYKTIRGVDGLIYRICCTVDSEDGFDEKNNLDVLIVFSNLLIKIKESAEKTIINSQMREISILHAKIFLNEDKVCSEIVEIDSSQTLNEHIKQLRSKLHSVQEKRIG